MKDFNIDIVSKRIKELRVYNEYSQKQLGELLGVAQNTVAQYESGAAKPSLEIIFKLARVFETSTDYILGFTDIY